MSRIPTPQSESNIVIESAQRLTICYLKGYLSHSSTDILINHVSVNEAGIDTIILDMSELITLSSSGVGAICKLSLDMLKSIIIVCPYENVHIRRFITEIGLDHIVVLKDSITSAMNLVATKLEVTRSKVSL